MSTSKSDHHEQCEAPYMTEHKKLHCRKKSLTGGIELDDFWVLAINQRPVCLWQSMWTIQENQLIALKKKYANTIYNKKNPTKWTYLFGDNTAMRWSKGLNGHPNLNLICEQLRPLRSDAKGPW